MIAYVIQNDSICQAALDQIADHSASPFSPLPHLSLFHPILFVTFIFSSHNSHLALCLTFNKIQPLGKVKNIARIANAVPVTLYSKVTK